MNFESLDVVNYLCNEQVAKRPVTSASCHIRKHHQTNYWPLSSTSVHLILFAINKSIASTHKKPAAQRISDLVTSHECDKPFLSHSFYTSSNNATNLRWSSSLARIKFIVLTSVHYMSHLHTVCTQCFLNTIVGTARKKSSLEFCAWFYSAAMLTLADHSRSPVTNTPKSFCPSQITLA
jgi:hypothetical protein